MVADAVERFFTEVERFEYDVGAPDSMVIAAGDECIEGVLAGMTPWAMPTVVSESDGLGEGNIEPERTSDGCGDLCDLEGVRKPCSLVVVGKDEDLGLSGEATKRWRMQDAVAVTLETGAVLVGFFGDRSVAGTNSESGPIGEK
jgi:hypothetical protein